LDGRGVILQGACALFTADTGKEHLKFTNLRSACFEIGAAYILAISHD
jgi:hypothetical protein